MIKAGDLVVFRKRTFYLGVYSVVHHKDGHRVFLKRLDNVFGSVLIRRCFIRKATDHEIAEAVAGRMNDQNQNLEIFTEDPITKKRTRIGRVQSMRFNVKPLM